MFQNDKNRSQTCVFKARNFQKDVGSEISETTQTPSLANLKYIACI